MDAHKRGGMRKYDKCQIVNLKQFEQFDKKINDALSINQGIVQKRSKVIQDSFARAVEANCSLTKKKRVEIHQ